MRGHRGVRVVVVGDLVHFAVTDRLQSKIRTNYATTAAGKPTSNDPKIANAKISRLRTCDVSCMFAFANYRHD
jgi:hypothetical protein